jgi:surface-anchored protein
MRLSTPIALLAAGFVAAPTLATTEIDSGHWDLEVETEFGDPASSVVDEVELKLKNKDFGSGDFPTIEELEPDEGILVPGNFRIQSGPLGGIADGSPVWFVPEVQDPTTLWLGLGSEETGAGVLVNDTYTLDLVAFSGPGNFVASQAGVGGPTIFVDTADGLAGDQLFASAVGDNHYEYAFDTEGVYELTFTASGTLTQQYGGGDVSATATYTFLIPEPATASVLALAGLFGLRRRR